MNDSPPPSRAAVKFEDVSKAFADRHVLDHVSFEVEEGTAFCLLGRSGTGKSVSLKLMIGLLKPDQGRIFIRDSDITRLRSHELPDIRKSMGFLFQNSALFDSLSVGENVAFPLRRHSKKSESEIQTVVSKKLGQVGLEKDAAKMPSDLSGGMRKRASLARALALDPSILLVDEPSSGLDPITSREIDELLLGLKSGHGTTLVIVTHNIPSARRIGDRLAVLDKGQIVSQGTAAELDRSNHPLVREFMKSEAGG